jgi:hypothetical protein
MLRRAGFILLAHYLATLTELILCPIAGKRLNLGQTLHDTLLLRQGYDLLPFYVCMIALSPLLLEMLRRGLWWIVSAASVAAFVAGSSNPWLMGFPLQHDFFPLLWQLIFVAGMLAGSQLTNYDRLSVKTKSQVALVVGLLSILLTLAARLEAGGVVLPAHLTFLKVPLSVGEAMRYVAIILTILIGSDLLWNRIDGSAISRFVNRLGRRSLGMAMIHVWVVIGALRLADAVQPAAPWAMALMAATVGALGLIARSLDALAEFWRGWQPRWPRLEYVAVPTLAVVVFVILAVANPPDPARATVQFEQVAVASPRVATYSRTQPMRSIQIARRATAGGITRSKAS